MSQLAKQSIRRLCLTEKPMIFPFLSEKTIINGTSAGLSTASYDVRIGHDLVLGVHPGLILGKMFAQEFGYVQWDEFQQRAGKLLRDSSPNFALAHTIEHFNFPDQVSGAVCDKSTHARRFMSAFNTFFDPGFEGYATLELINFSDEELVFKKGDPICQFIFNSLDVPTETTYSGKYQHQSAEAHPARHEPFDDPSRRGL